MRYHCREMTPKELLHSWFEEVWNRHNDAFVHDHFGYPCELVGLPEEACTPAGFIEFRNGLQAGISEMHISVLDSMEEDDRTIGTCRVTGIHSATGNPIEFCFGYTATVRDGKIVKAHNIIDFLSMLQQAKIIPEDALIKGLMPDLSR